MSVEEVLARNGLSMKCTLDRTMQSSVTASWGVKWNEVEIARDLLQNFYDANRTSLESVAVRGDRDVLITAPGAFDVERLFYLGSEKTSDDVGQFGEGFKAAATCLLRDHEISPIGISGSTLVQVRLSTEAVNRTKLRPLLYDFYRIEPAHPGAVLILPDCQSSLKREVELGMSHFFFEKNPFLGKRLWESPGRQYALYKSSTPDGHIFYRRLKRATVSGIPVVLVIHEPVRQIDSKVQRDRDRNVFEKEVLTQCYKSFSKSALMHPAAACSILSLSKHLWHAGHPLLHALSEGRDIRATQGIEKLFGDQYFAALWRPKEATLEEMRVEAAWESEKRQRLPAYFVMFGVPSADVHLREVRKRALAEERQKARGLTPAEKNSIDVLFSTLHDLSPYTAEFFTQRHVTYSVGETETVLGALRESRGYRSLEVYLAATLFTEDFSRALAVFLHEHVHIFGFDGSRGFTDALTELIEAVVGSRNLLDHYEQQWAAARDAVRAERGSLEQVQANLSDRLSGLDRQTLEDMLKQVPPNILKPLMDRAGSAPRQLKGRKPARSSRLN